MFNELRQLSQALIQNGGSLYDVIELYSTKSMREMKKTFKDLRDQQLQQQQAAQQQQQAQLKQQGKIAEAQAATSSLLFNSMQEQLAHDDYQKELDSLI